MHPPGCNPPPCPLKRGNPTTVSRPLLPKLKAIPAFSGDYQGVSVREWILGLAAIGLTGNQIISLNATNRSISGLDYYFREPLVPLLQWGGLAIAVLVGLGVLLAIIFPSFRPILLRSLPVLAITGAGLVWIELTRALLPNPNRIYELSDLPFRPINNFGLLGSTLFIGYLLFCLPHGKVPPIPLFFIRAALVAAFYLVQDFTFASFLTS